MQITHILLPVDGSNHSKHATEHAIYFAKLSGARITVVNCYEWHGHVLEIPGHVVEDLKKKLANQSAEILEKTSQLLKEEGIDHEVKLLIGSPGKLLSNMAKSKEFDLIIMGSHGHSDISGLFLGSVTHKVLNTIYCPVIVVP